VAEAELEGDGSQPAVTAGNSSSGKSWDDAPFRREGVDVQLPADAAARLRVMWDEYSSCVFGAVTLYKCK
jgi:hypothetical protein